MCANDAIRVLLLSRVWVITPNATDFALRRDQCFHIVVSTDWTRGTRSYRGNVKGVTSLLTRVAHIC